jgi:hypothetical protein
MIGVRVSERAAVADVGAARWERLKCFGMPEGRVVRGQRVFAREELADALDAMLQSEARAARAARARTGAVLAAVATAERRREAARPVPPAIEKAYLDLRRLVRKELGI